MRKGLTTAENKYCEQGKEGAICQTGGAFYRRRGQGTGAQGAIALSPGNYTLEKSGSISYL